MLSQWSTSGHPVLSLPAGERRMRANRRSPLTRRERCMLAGSRLRPLDPSVSPRFGDVATVLRAPRVAPGPGIDIALVGVPFDLGTNYRTGARGGPAAVREASRTIRLVHPTSLIAPFE